MKQDGADWGERLSALFDQHHQRLYRLALRLCGNAEDARDLVQDTFLRIARRPAAVPRGAAQAEAWLVTVLVNLTRDLQRRQSVRSRNPLDDVASAVPRPSPNPETSAVAGSTVRAALAQLDPRRRAIVVLRDLEELPVKEVARLLGIQPVTVRWHHAAGLRQLAKILPINRSNEGAS